MFNLLFIAEYQRNKLGKSRNDNLSASLQIWRLISIVEKWGICFIDWDTHDSLPWIQLDHTLQIKSKKLVWYLYFNYPSRPRVSGRNLVFNDIHSWTGLGRPQSIDGAADSDRENNSFVFSFILYEIYLMWPPKRQRSKI